MDFVNAVANQVKTNGQKTRDVLSLSDQKKNRITELTPSQFAIQILDFLFRGPLFTSTRFIEARTPPGTSAAR